MQIVHRSLKFRIPMRQRGGRDFFAGSGLNNDGLLDATGLPRRGGGFSNGGFGRGESRRDRSRLFRMFFVSLL